MHHRSEKRPLHKKPIMWEPSADSLPIDFCLNSSLHGLKYIGQEHRHVTERIFWFAAFVTSIFTAGYFIGELWMKYNTTPVIVSFQSKETTIDQLPFPAVTICNVNNVLQHVAEEFMAKVENSDIEDDEAAYADLYYLDHVCSTSTFSKYFNFSKTQGTVRESLKQKLEDALNGTIPLKDSVQFLQSVAQNCSNMIKLCYWADEARNCEDLFDPIETDYGYCCTFNMVPRSVLLKLLNDSREDEDTFRRWNKKWTMEKLLKLGNERQNSSSILKRQLREGRRGGLSVLLNPDLDNYFCTNTDSVGFQMTTHLPLQFPHLADNGLAVKPNSEVFVSVRPLVTTAEDSIRGVALEKRGCYFGEEYDLKFFQFYTFTNCMDECIANITYKQCECVRYYQPRENSTKLCGPTGYACTENVRKQLLKVGVRKKCTQCLPTCSEVVYLAEESYLPLRSDINLWEYPDGESASWANKNVSIVHVYFATESTHARVRSVLYGTTDLLSNTGGLLGLCMGFSGLSLLEIIYFLTFRAWWRNRCRRKDDDGNKSSSSSLTQCRRFICCRPELEYCVQQTQTLDLVRHFASPRELKIWAIDNITKSTIRKNPYHSSSNHISFEISPKYHRPTYLPAID